ncbi:MAG: hypothetical protein LBS36_12520 [Oscillospiraceae bacterium]|jgi:hypothetical protein|nr:hypothetical protein [Oscillospiraceae bacterium]
MDLSNLLSSLSESDMEQLKQTAASLLGGMGGGNSSPPPTANSDNGEISVEPAQPANAGLGALGSLLGSGSGSGTDTGITQTLARLGGMVNTPDARCDFLIALKPLLKEEHRDRADQAAKMLRLMNALPMLREGGLFRGLFS